MLAIGWSVVMEAIGAKKLLSNSRFGYAFDLGSVGILVSEIYVVNSG